MNAKNFFLSVLLAAVCPVRFFPQPAHADEPTDFTNADNACTADIGAWCKNVKPGDGQLRSCLQQNKTNLSPDCRAALNKDAKARFDAACGSDADKLCAAEAKQGAKAVVACIKANAPKLSAPCARLMNLAPASPPGASRAAEPDPAAKSGAKRNALSGFFLPPVK